MYNHTNNQGPIGCFSKNQSIQKFHCRLKDSEKIYCGLYPDGKSTFLAYLHFLYTYLAVYKLTPIGQIKTQEGLEAKLLPFTSEEAFPRLSPVGKEPLPGSGQSYSAKRLRKTDNDCWIVLIIRPS